MMVIMLAHHSRLEAKRNEHPGMINRLGTPGAVGFFKCLDELY